MTATVTPAEQPADPTTTVQRRTAEEFGEPRDGGKVLWVDPRELIVGDNVRTDVALEKGFVADIAERGVRQPVPVYRDESGRLVVRTGQRRVLAAIAAGLDRVRVLVEPRPVDDERDQQIARIIDQLGENTHRCELSDADEVRATQQLLGLGLTAGQIARRRHIGTKRVRQAAQVARHQVALDAVTAGRLDLAQAAVVAEFGDDAAAVEQLTTAAAQRPEQFDHIAQRLRDAQQEARLREAVVAQLAEAGVTVVDRPDSLFDGALRRLAELRPGPDADPGTELTAEAHAACPGHAAFVEDRGSWRPADQRVRAVYVCTDFRAHGHAERFTSPGQVSTGPVSGPMSEEQKAERRRVIANNKAWDSATTVRRDWVRRLFARKAAPADGARWVARVLAHGCHDLRKAMESDHQLACELLGLTPGERGYARREAHPVAQTAANASPSRALTLTVALLVAALEAGTSRQTWRSPTPDQIAYFQQLQFWGYTLSDVELLVIAPEQADQPDDGDEAADPVAEPSPADPASDHVGPVTEPDGTAEVAPGADTPAAVA